MRCALAPLAAAGLLLLGRAASACAVCTAGREDETQLAFLLTTVFLSVLPLAIVGGGLWWLRRRARALESERRGETPSVLVTRAADPSPPWS